MSKTSAPRAALSALAVALATIAPAAHAVTECLVTPADLFVGGDPPASGGNSYFYASWLEGGAGVVNQSDPNYKSMLAVVMTAKVMHQKVRIRYLPDNASCTAGNPGPVLGIWML